MNNRSRRIGFLGTGHIAAPLARRMVRLGHSVWATERSASVSALLARDHGVQLGDTQSVIDAVDVVFICLRPAQAPDILKTLRFRKDQQFISVMAENDHAALTALCAPATEITRMIPFGFAETGGCPLPVWGPSSIIHELFGPENIVLDMGREEDLSAILTASAFMASQLDLLHSVGLWTAAQTGDADVAEAYIKNLVLGYLSSMPKHTGALAEDRDALTLPGSLNHYVMQALQENGTHAALSGHLDTVYKRLNAQ